MPQYLWVEYKSWRTEDDVTQRLSEEGWDYVCKIEKDKRIGVKYVLRSTVSDDKYSVQSILIH